MPNPRLLPEKMIVQYKMKSMFKLLLNFLLESVDHPLKDFYKVFALARSEALHFSLSKRLCASLISCRSWK
jgi:hypothetical protein